MEKPYPSASDESNAVQPTVIVVAVLFNTMTEEGGMDGAVMNYNNNSK